MNGIPTWAQIRHLIIDGLKQQLQRQMEFELAFTESRLDPPSEDQIVYMADAIARCDFTRPELQRLLQLAQVGLPQPGARPVRRRPDTTATRAATGDGFDWSKSDAALGRKHNVSRERIRQIRKQLGLPPAPRKHLPPPNMASINPSLTMCANAKAMGIPYWRLRKALQEHPATVPMKLQGMAAIKQATEASNVPLHLPDIALAEITSLPLATFSVQRMKKRLPQPIITGHAWSIIRKSLSIENALELLKQYANSPTKISGTFFKRLLQKQRISK